MIRRIDPDDWQHANVVQLDSDASDNIQAMKEIEQWASENGFARTDEYRLRRAILCDNARVFRGICYRLNQDEQKIIEESEQRNAARMARMPMTLVEH